MMSMFSKTTTIAILSLWISRCGDIAAKQQVIIHQMTGRTTKVDTSQLPADWSAHTANHQATAGMVTKVRVTGGPVRVIFMPTTKP